MKQSKLRTRLAALSVGVLALVTFVPAAEQAAAAAPVISSVVHGTVYTGAQTYRAYIDQADVVSANTWDSAYLPSVDGVGCHLVFHVNTRNHAKIIDALYCSSPGWVEFRTQPTYSYLCGTVFTLTASNVDGSSSYSDPLRPCGPPLPPSVTVDVTGNQVTFTNPASVVQSASYSRSVSSLSCVWQGNAGFTTQTIIRYARSGPNFYTYYWGSVYGSLNPGEVVVLNLVCP